MTRDKNPLQYAGCYSLDVYCDRSFSAHADDGRPVLGQFTGATFGECAREARAAGWVIHKDRTATCPQCRRTSR